jgi:RNAse (barnase) inhibitor barstar
MTSSPELRLYPRKSLDQITQTPDDIISVYVVEQHIWSNKGTEEERAFARKNRIAESQTVAEFLIDPVRSFLMDFFRQISAPYDRNRKDIPIGQGYWIQAEFGSGKSHLLSVIGALALGGEKEWEIVREKEEKLGKGKRDSLYYFYENGLKKKTQETRGLLVAVKTLVGQGGGSGSGLSGAEKNLADYILEAVGEQYYLENGHSLPLYPTEILAERFLQNDLERYSRDLGKFLQDPKYFDEENRETLEEFLGDLQNNQDPGVRRDCGQRLWDFYKLYLKVTPDIPVDTEPKLKHMVDRLLEEGYAGLLIILDEVSLFMKGRSESQRVEDEKALVVLSNRLAKVENLPVWTVCAAQQAIETKLVGVKNIIADERLKLIPLLNQSDYYYDIALARVREITDKAAIDQYYEDYSRSFSWPKAVGKDQFARFFPFYPPAIDVVRAVSYNLTTIRSALYFMLQTLKTQRKRHSNELITLWSLFEDVVTYEEDPSGTTRSIASIKTKFPEEWQAYEEAKRQIDNALTGQIKVYRSRCEKIVKTLFLYHVANLSQDGLSSEELMNCVMEWRDHDKGQTTDTRDNIDHYEVLSEKLDIELVQVEKVGGKYRFNVTGSGPNPVDIFQKARSEAEQNEIYRRDAWYQLLSLDGWEIRTNFLTIELASGTQSLFRDIAPESQKDITLKWHGREITGRVYMRNLLDIAKRGALLPSINSAETGLDFAVYISNAPAGSDLDQLVKDKGDPRVLFWSPDLLTPAEEALLLDFAAYRSMVAETIGKETESAKQILDWVRGRLGAQMGTIYRIIPDSFGRGQIKAADHSSMAFLCQGELTSVLTPLVEQVLDSTYVCKDMLFDAQAPFNDLNAINVINGIVKAGEFPRNVKPGKEVSASWNYGFSLAIMRKPNDHKLDLRDCRYTKEMLDWIEDKIGSSGASMTAATIYKNFMGIGGPGGLNYGLSKRMVQLYLLCLAREGRIRITLSGRNLPAEAIDYSNIAAIDFKMATLDAFDQIQMLKPPEGWGILAPFAAVLLNDDSIKSVGEDVEIQKSVQRIIEYKKENLEAFHKLRQGIEDLFKEMGKELELSERLAAWEAFLACPVEIANAISFLRNGLEKAFGYPVYHDETVRPEDVDDLVMRRREIEQVEKFYTYREQIRAGMRYLAVDIPDAPELADIKRNLAALKQRFSADSQKGRNLDAWTKNETMLLNEFIHPLEAIIQSYRVRYLQAFDQVVSHTEQARQELGEIEKRPEFQTLAALAQVKALGADPCPAILSQARQYSSSADLFPANLTRASVERDLAHWPQPANCPLTLGNSADWIGKANAALQAIRESIQTALMAKIQLLLSPSLQQRLRQGEEEAFIHDLLASQTTSELADKLVSYFTGSDRDALLRLLEKYLKQVIVIKINMNKFVPSKRTFEGGEISQLVSEFTTYLQNQVRNKNSEDQTIVIEIE